MLWRRKRTDYHCERCKISTSVLFGRPVPSCKCGTLMVFADQPCLHPAYRLVVDLSSKVPPCTADSQCYCLGCRRYLVRCG